MTLARLRKMQAKTVGNVLAYWLEFVAHLEAKHPGLYRRLTKGQQIAVGWEWASWVTESGVCHPDLGLARVRVLLKRWGLLPEGEQR
jgi:hypothetical protein